MFNVVCCDKQPFFDVLPVYKARFFDGDFKQLMHAKIAYVSDDGFYFDVVKFERDPVIIKSGEFSPEDSTIAVSFDLSENSSGPVLSVLLNSEGKSKIFLDEEESGPVVSDIFLYRGSDELGWHWGTRFLISNGMCSEVFGKHKFSPGEVVRGNIYAVLTTGERAHFGAVAPFAVSSVYCVENLADFLLSNA